MDEIQFIYQVSSVDAQAMLPQVSSALEKRLEIRRQQMRPRNTPDLSAMTEEQKAAYKKQQRIKNIIWGVIFAAVGLYLLIPAIEQPKGMIFQLIVGVLAIILGLNKILRGGIIKEEIKDKTKFDQAAREFLDEQVKRSLEAKTQIVFFDDEMVTITGELEELDQDPVEYAEVEFSMETEDMFLVTFGNRGVMLQKKDLTMGSVEEFREFLRQHVKVFVPMEKKYTPAEAVDEPEQAYEDQTEEKEE